MSDNSPAAPSHGHPGAATYVRLAVILAIITMAEVATYYVDALESVLIPILIVLSIAKFALVAMYYMHLKFDARLLSGIFLWGLFVGLSITLAMMALHSAF